MRRAFGFLALSIVAVSIVLGFVFAGSPTTIADGVRIDGVDVGGLQVTKARALLERKAAALASRPVIFTAGGQRFAIRPVELGVRSDWRAAVDSAQRQGSGFAPLRGFKRLGVDFFGADVTPPTSVLTGALQYELARIAAAVDRPPRNASLALREEHVVVVPAQTGLALDRSAAATLLVHELATLGRSALPVQLPTRVTQPRIHVISLQRAARQARIALSAPVRLELGPTRWVLTPAQIAPLLEFPASGLRIGGAAADAWLRRLGKRVEKPARDATFAVDGPKVRIVPDRPGVRLDAVRAAAALLAAALRTRAARRIATLPVESSPAQVTTAKARAMGITGLVSAYTTEYGGVPNRIHNVQL
ncbi:MAG TPA: peptidoglycan binding domain-containing protein, partial [Gaiellaceae bacterium]|nr:peptidoglycan binding domain-containing protein [Gaiellaceae bacterium]